jgi:hypothetical protein
MLKVSRSRIVAVAAVAPALATVVGFAALGGGSGGGQDPASYALRDVWTVTASAQGLPAIRSPQRAAATWCGTPSQLDLAPNAVAGFPVHWLYALPSDGADRFATFANAMQTDAEAIDAWWRREDPARTPRNDLAPLPCGQQLDLTTLRLQLSGAALTGDGRFGSIFNALAVGNFRSPFTKYVVYYDGPVANGDICGQGGSDGSGFGLAVVYVQACADVPTAAVAAHELLHTFGAVPDGAPHDCPEPNDGHTCDNQSDLMYPFINAGTPLSSMLLDPGRDDYYGHASGFGDSQDAAWLVQLDRQQPFTVTIAGPGAIRADVPGMQCGQTCTTTWNAGTRLGLSATPDPGAKLVRWSGSCTGAGACSVTTNPGAAVNALFAPLVYRLTVTVGGRGTVQSSRSGIACRPRCSAAFPSHVPVRLTATPSKGWRFRSWAGACRGRNRSCTVPMTAAARARAIFARVR